MSIDLTVTFARRGDARLRDQRARIEQRHLQFGRHCLLDIGSLLLRAAHRVRVAPLAEVRVHREDVPMDPAQTRDARAVDDWMPAEAHDAAHALEATTL
jgi:hypothetical protein